MSKLELRCKLQEKLHHVTGPIGKIRSKGNICKIMLMEYIAGVDANLE